MQVDPARSEGLIDSDRAWQRPRLRLRRMCFGAELYGCLTRARDRENMLFFVSGSDEHGEYYTEKFDTLGGLLAAGWRVDDDKGVN